MRILELKADWLWSLAGVSHSLAGGGPYADQIRIEDYEGHPLLIATDMHMLTVVHATESSVYDFDRPVTLQITGELRRALSKAGANGRPKRRVDIAIERCEGDADADSDADAHIVAIDIDGTAGRSIQLRGEDASSCVSFKRWIKWRRILPAAERLEGTWREIVEAQVDGLNPINMELLRKLPRFAEDGGIIMQPVMLAESLHGDGHNTSCWIVREVDIADQAFTLVMPRKGLGAIHYPLPDFAREVSDADTESAS